jgi:hypothetical protein
MFAKVISPSTPAAMGETTTIKLDDGLSLKDEKETLQNDHIEHNPALDDEWKAKEKKLVRRLDMTLMPMVWILYLFNYLDRNNIA